MKTIHYLNKELSILESTGVAACGTYVSTEKFGDNMTSKRENVTCGRCKQSRIYRQTKDQQTCKRCGRIVGCNMNGRKHKCNCGKSAKIPDDRNYTHRN